MSPARARPPRRAALLLAAAALAAGCASKEERIGVRVVRAYNETAIRAYAEGIGRIVEPVATRKQWRKIVILVDLKTSNDIALESRLEKLSFERVEAQEQQIVVTTSERWRYHDRPVKPGVAAGPEFLADMRMQYVLLHEDGAWKVDLIRTLDHAYLDPVTGAPRPRAPRSMGQHGADEATSRGGGEPSQGLERRHEPPPRSP